MKIVVTSGYSRSRHAIALIAMLAREGHEVGLCLNVRTVNLSRMRSYYRYYGRRLFGIVRRRMMHRGTGGSLHPEVKYIQAYLERNEIECETVKHLCDSMGIPMVNVNSLNDERAIAVTRRFGPDLIVYAGGGLLRKQLIDVPRLGVLNAHGGPLPQVRGMNAAEWALMLGLPLGTHAHFMDAGVDTGPLLFFRPMQACAGDSIGDIRGKSVVEAVEAHLEAVARLQAGTITAEPQIKKEGRQYFDMHRLLVEIIEDRLRDPKAGGAVNV